MSTPEHLKFLAANGHSLAPLTGTDYKALAAIAELWKLYAYTRHTGVLVAVAWTLCEMQASTRDLARPLIAYAMDWSDVDGLWAVVCPPGGASEATAALTKLAREHATDRARLVFVLGKLGKDGAQ